MASSWLETLQSLGGFGERLEQVGFLPLAGLLLVSLLVSLLMSGLYLFFYEGPGTGSQLHRAFPLIGLSVTTIFLAVQFSLPLSLGLLGALSIVRFRTPVKEPEEIGFILLVIATSLCVATFSLVFLGLVIVAAVLGLLVLRFGKGPFRRRGADGVVVVAVPRDDFRAHGAALLALLSEQLAAENLESVATRPDETVVTFGFAARQRERALALEPRIAAITQQARTSIYTGAVLS